MTRRNGLSGAAADPVGTLGVVTVLAAVPLADRPGLRLSGEVDLSTRGAFVAALDLLDGADGDVHLELRDVTFIDVGGATVLVKKAAQFGAGRQLVLHDPPEMLTRTLELLWGRSPAIEMETA